MIKGYDVDANGDPVEVDADGDPVPGHLRPRPYLYTVSKRDLENRPPGSRGCVASALLSH